jgi:hypothetical protein
MYKYIYEGVFNKINGLTIQKRVDQEKQEQEKQEQEKQEQEKQDEEDHYISKYNIKMFTLKFLIELNEDKYLDLNKYEKATESSIYKRILRCMTQYAETYGGEDDIYKNILKCLNEFDENANRCLIKEENSIKTNRTNRGCNVMGGTINTFVTNIQNICICIIICIIIVLIYYIVKEHIIYKKYNSLRLNPKR